MADEIQANDKATAEIEEKKMPVETVTEKIVADVKVTEVKVTEGVKSEVPKNSKKRTIHEISGGPTTAEKLSPPDSKRFCKNIQHTAESNQDG